jgi:hypothetical protein
MDEGRMQSLTAVVKKKAEEISTEFGWRNHTQKPEKR